MKRQDLILKFLDKGKLITPLALEQLEKEEDLSVFLEKDGVFMTEYDFERIQILKNITSKTEEMSISDFVSYYQSKFSKIRNIFLKEKPLAYVSIDKINNTFKKGTIIGMVVSKENGLTVEDMTGVVTLKGGDADLDDVVAFEVEKKGVFEVKRVIYPDVPLRAVKTGSGRAMFVSDLHLDRDEKGKKFLKWFGEQDVKDLFIAGDIGDKRELEKWIEEGKHVFVIPGEADGDSYPQLPLNLEGDIISLSNPSMVELNGLKVLLVHEFKKEMLTKRHLGTMFSPEDQMVLEDVPDIVHCGHTHKQIISNYKSITIVNSGSPLTPIVIDFKTRRYKVVKI